MSQNRSYEQLLDHVIRLVNRLKRDTESSFEHIQQSLDNLLYRQQSIEKCVDILSTKTHRLETDQQEREAFSAPDEAPLPMHPVPHTTPEAEYELLLTQMFQTVFANDSHVQQAAQSCVDKLFAAHPPSTEHLQGLQKLAQQLGALVETLATLLDLVKQIDGPAERLMESYQRLVRLGQEITDYQRCYQDKYCELTMAISLQAQTAHGLLHSVVSTLRNAMRKILDPLGYFTDKFESFVAGDLVTLIDICDNLKTAEHVTDVLQRLLQCAGLEDISPQVGTPFNAQEQTLIGFRDGAARETILSVNRRGLRYKQRTIRKASVIIGR